MALWERSSSCLSSMLRVVLLSCLVAQSHITAQLLNTFLQADNIVSVYSVAWSPDGQYLASGGADKTVRIWDPVAGVLVQTLTSESEITSVDWSQDGQQVASGSQDGNIRIWDVTTGQLVRIFTNHTRWVEQVAWSHAEPFLLASASLDGTARFWNPSTGELVRTLEHISSVYSVAWSPDGFKLATGLGRDEAAVRIYKFAELEDTIPSQLSRVQALAWSPDGEQLAWGGGNDGTVRIRENGQVLREIDGNEGDVWQLAFSPDGTYLASSGRDCDIRIWDMSKGTLFRNISNAHSCSVWTVAWSPDGTRLASGGIDARIRIWDPFLFTEAPTSSPTMPESSGGSGRVIVGCFLGLALALWLA